MKHTKQQTTVIFTFKMHPTVLSYSYEKLKFDFVLKTVSVYLCQLFCGEKYTLKDCLCQQSLCTCLTVLLPNKQTTQEVMWTKERTLPSILYTANFEETFSSCNYKLCQYLTQTPAGCSGEARGIYSSISTL